MTEGITPDPQRVQFVQGGRPHFFDDPVNDQLMAMIMALLGEVCVLRERLDTVERLAAARGIWEQKDLETYLPTGEAAADRNTIRAGIMGRVLSVLEEEVVRLRHEAQHGTGKDMAGSGSPKP